MNERYDPNDQSAFCTTETHLKSLRVLPRVLESAARNAVSRTLRLKSDRVQKDKGDDTNYQLHAANIV
jgi:hypothetical protein